MRSVTLAEALSAVIDHRGKTPKKLGGDFSSSGVRVLSAKNIKGGRITDDDVRYISEAMFHRWMPIRLRTGDVLLTSEAPLGQVAYLMDERDYVLGQRLFGLRANPDILDSRFLYYALQSDLHQSRLHARATGTTAQGVRQSELLKVLIDLPPLEEQRAASHLLGVIDGKIDVNRCMNETLEAMAAAIFKAWFVDFEPVRAKMEGRRPFGIGEETAALFPDDFEDQLPRGWRTGRLDEIAEVVMGQSPAGETYNEGGIGLPFYQGTRDFGYRYPRRRVYCSAPTRYARAGEVLLSVRAPVGRVNIAGEPCAIGRGLAALRSKAEPAGFLYETLRATRSGWEKFEAAGTVFGSASKQDVITFAVIVPPMGLMRRFGEVVEPLNARLRLNESESKTLADLRDALLPKLLSGELRLNEAESEVAAAI